MAGYNLGPANVAWWWGLLVGTTARYRVAHHWNTGDARKRLPQDATGYRAQAQPPQHALLIRANND